MTVKEHLRSICSYERIIHEAGLKLDKMRRAKEDAKNDAEQKRKQLQENLDKKQLEINQVEEEVKRKEARSAPNATFEIIVSIIATIMVILTQVLIRFLVVDVMGGCNLGSATLNFTIIYAVIGMIVFLILHYCFGYNWGAFFSCLVGFIATLFVTYTYLDFAISQGMSVNGAIVLSYVVLDVLGVSCAIMFCISGYKNDKKAYYANLQEIRRKKKLLERKQSEYMQLKEEVVAFEELSKQALNSMQLDILQQEKYIKDNRTRLATIYAQNVLHPNYQNWVAAATIYEYLDVGRCYELKGPAGAYNLYEKELIAKKILDSLSAINSSISYYGSSISSSQHYIRAQLDECNRNVAQMSVNRYGL